MLMIAGADSSTAILKKGESLKDKPIVALLSSGPPTIPMGRTDK